MLVCYVSNKKWVIFNADEHKNFLSGQLYNGAKKPFMTVYYHKFIAHKIMNRKLFVNKNRLCQ